MTSTLDDLLKAHPRLRPLIQAAARNEWHGLTVMEIQAKYGTSTRTIAKVRRLTGAKSSLRDKYPFDIMNWELPSVDLERIWKLPRNRAGFERWRKNYPKPTWRCNGGHWPKSPEYRKAVTAEESKAAQWRQSQGKVSHG